MSAPQYTVLIAEDEPLLQQSLAEVLEGAGYKVLLGKNGKEALDLALAKHPTIILADHLMPVMNGIDMVKELRKDPWGKKVPVVIITNNYNATTLNESLEAGVTDYVMKSDVGVDRVVQLVQSRLKSAGL
jgi:CheY-like chemotaxis protein